MFMKKLILLVLISFAFFHQVSYACSCGGPFTFCEGIADSDGNLYADLILRGKITAKTNEGTEVQIDNLLYGNSSQSKIMITPSLCDIYFDPLEEGNEYIFAVSDFNNSFTLLSCAISYLKIEDEVIKGMIAPGVESLNYSDFITLENCGNGFEFFLIENNLSVFPNPTVDILTIKNENFNQSAENVQAKFIDALGREIFTFKNEDEILSGESWSINIQYFAAGVYYVKLTANHQETVIRIVKL